jgi:biotin carboxylase
LSSREALWQPRHREAQVSEHGARHIYVLGLSDEDRALLRRMPEDSGVAIHELVPRSRFRGVEALPIEDLVAAAEARLRAAAAPVAGILSFIDFPASEIMGLLNERFGLRGPDLRAVLACNHKYWSRQLQAEVAPEAVPPFAAFDPFDETAFDRLTLALPLWVKPLNAFCSHLGFRVRSREDFEQAAAQMRISLDKLAEPLAYFLERAELPEEIRRLGGRVAIAEGLIGGRQCTLEGYVFNGEPVVYGVVDSIREANGSSFARYQYPSQLPPEARERMADIAIRVMRRTGFDNGTFNMEFFYDPPHDRVWLLEINPRLSQSHFELFEKVNGVSSQQVAFDVVTGRRPMLPYGQGPHRVAAKFFLRSWRAGRVTRVPGKGELRGLHQDHPGLTIEITVRRGQDLARLQDQDSYSYELAHAWLGADSQPELLRQWEAIRRRLRFEIDGAPLS